jgi:hypothetical protein
MIPPTQTEPENRPDSVRVHKVERMSRGQYHDMFASDYKWQHKTSIGPTQRGKTTETMESLDRVITSDKTAVILAAKPAHRDPVMNKAAEKLHLRRIEEWPPPNSRWWEKQRGYRGYVLQPKQAMKPNMTIDEYRANNENVRRNFQRAMLDCYASKHKVILVCDEAHKICNNYKLKDEYEASLMSGQPDVAEWSNIQRGRYMSYLAYDAPEYILFYQEPDRANTRRYAEMVGGVNRDQVADIVEGLQTYEIKSGQTISEILVVRRSGPRLIIVDVE